MAEATAHLEAHQDKSKSYVAKTKRLRFPFAPAAAEKTPVLARRSHSDWILGHPAPDLAVAVRKSTSPGHSAKSRKATGFMGRA
jgi:hypothetical protein